MSWAFDVLREITRNHIGPAQYEQDQPTVFSNENDIWRIKAFLSRHAILAEGVLHSRVDIIFFGKDS
jgi:hypothetical protein